MNRIIGFAAGVVTVCVPLSAEAAPPIVLQPIQLAQEMVRFDRGDFVIDQASAHAIVEVRPASDDHGQKSFVVLVLNTGPTPVNVDVANIRVEGTDQPVRLVGRTEMERKAVNRAGVKKFFTALGGALNAASLANETSHYSGTATTLTPVGIFRTDIDISGSSPCGGCRIASERMTEFTAARIDQIRQTLDSQRDALRQNSFQLTTIDPGRGYGGRVFLSKFKPKPMSPIRLVVTVGEEAFAFAFRFAPEGTPAPQYRMTTITAAPTLAAASAIPAVALRPALAPVVPHSAFGVATASAQPVAVAYTPAPQPGARRTGSGVAIKWRNYYNALLASGVSRTQAHTMADEQFGAID